LNAHAYSIVIATFERPAELRVTLESIATQTRLPARVIVVDSSRNDESRTAVATFSETLPIDYVRADAASAALQRNQGAELVTTPLIAFLDDDVIIARETFAAICEVFDADEAERIGGVAGRIEGMQHSIPGRLLWCYYRLQAGYAHPTYGGKLFGPAINCLPVYDDTSDALIAADWLLSTCVFYRTPLFLREKFPRFSGYSFLEDVHLSSRIGRTHQLYFHRTAMFEHRDAPSDFKRNARQLARMRVRHQRLVASEILQLREPLLTCKLWLHQLFATLSILRRREPAWREAILGTWI
jgi:glycosyltransferase involved in cell wall biosynthesis